MKGKCSTAVLFWESCGDKVNVAKTGSKYAERERERCLALSVLSLNKCTLTSLGKTVTGWLREMCWKMDLLFLPFFFPKKEMGQAK